MASTSSRSDRRTTAEWHTLVRQQRDCGLSAAAFCRQHDLVYQTFVARRRQLGAEMAHASRSTSATTPPSLPGFVEIGVTEPAVAHRAPANEWLIELDIGEGMQLRIRSSR